VKPDCVIVRYGEIALKGGNRRSFEERLVANLKRKLEACGIKFRGVKRISGRLIVETESASAAAALAKVFGVTSASPARAVKPDVDEMRKTALGFFRKVKPAPKSFRVTARRLDKTF